MRRKRIGAAFLCVALLLPLGGCKSEEDKGSVTELKETALTAPQRTSVVRGDLRVTASYDATVSPMVEQLRFAEEGSFGEYRVNFGDPVAKGDILAVPALEELEDAVTEQGRALADLERNYEYQKASLENQMEIARLELDNVYNELKVLEYGTEEYTNMCILAGGFDEQRKRLSLQLAQLQEKYELQRGQSDRQLQRLKKKRDGNLIRAPFDGVVVALEGTHIPDQDTRYQYRTHKMQVAIPYGTPIDTEIYYVAVADPDVLYARCEYIPEVVLEHAEGVVFWKDGEEYEVAYVPQNEDYFKAVNNSKEQAYSQFLVRDSEGGIVSGDYGKIRLIVARAEDVLLLPATAVQTADGATYVYKEVEGSRQRVAVETGITDGILVEIRSGLEEGDVVYVQES